MTDENEDLIEFASPPSTTNNSSRRESRKSKTTTTTVTATPNGGQPACLLDTTLSTSGLDVGENESGESSKTATVTTSSKRLTFKEKKASSQTDSGEKPSILIHIDNSDSFSRLTASSSTSSSSTNNDATLVNNTNGRLAVDSMTGGGGEQTADLEIVDFDNEFINVDQDFW